MLNTDFQAFNQELHHLCFWLIYTVHTFNALMEMSACVCLTRVTVSLDVC